MVDDTVAELMMSYCMLGIGKVSGGRIIEYRGPFSRWRWFNKSFFPCLFRVHFRE